MYYWYWRLVGHVTCYLPQTWLVTSILLLLHKYSVHSITCKPTRHSDCRDSRRITAVTSSVLRGFNCSRRAGSATGTLHARIYLYWSAEREIHYEYSAPILLKVGEYKALRYLLIVVWVAYTLWKGEAGLSVELYPVY